MTESEETNGWYWNPSKQQPESRLLLNDRFEFNVCGSPWMGSLISLRIPCRRSVAWLTVGNTSSTDPHMEAPIYSKLTSHVDRSTATKRTRPLSWQGFRQRWYNVVFFHNTNWGFLYFIHIRLVSHIKRCGCWLIVVLLNDVHGVDRNDFVETITFLESNFKYLQRNSDADSSSLQSHSLQCILH